MRLRRLILVFVLLRFGQPAFAGVQNDVPSCYTANQIQPSDGRGYTKLLYVLIDQTVGWPSDIESSIMDNLNANLQPGTKFVIAEFSAFSEGRYLEVLHTGIIEEPMSQSQLNNTPITAGQSFEECLADQLPYAVKLADDTAVSVLKNSSTSLGNSDIMSALKQVSAVVAADPAPYKVVLLASDGLENSSVTSFYSHGGVRDIDPAREMSLAEAANLVGDFGGSRVYVIGGALSSPPKYGSQETRAGYRSPQVLEHLAEFWTMYFQKANADLVEFGEPDLLESVSF